MIFPVLAATHQVNRVAALAVAAAEMIAFGGRTWPDRAQRAAPGRRARPAWDPGPGGAQGLPRTHQVILDVRRFGGGLEAARRLEQANVITNKNLIPSDRADAWDRPGGLRLGSIEVTRLGMGEPEMDTIADFIARVLVEQAPPEQVAGDVADFRRPLQTLYDRFDHPAPPQRTGLAAR